MEIIEAKKNEQIQRVSSEVLGRLLWKATQQPEVMAVLVQDKYAGTLDTRLLALVREALDKVELELWDAAYRKASGERKSYGK